MAKMKISSWKIAAALLGVFSVAAFSPTVFAVTAKDVCYKLGDKATIKGRVIGRYFDLLSPYPLCVDYPKTISSGIRITNASTMEILGKTTPPGIFVEVT